MRRADSFEKTLMLGKIEGRRWRWPQRMRWLDDTIWLSGHVFEQTLGVGEGQGGLGCCNPWGCRELARLSDWIELTHTRLTSSAATWESTTIPAQRPYFYQSISKYGDDICSNRSLWLKDFISNWLKFPRCCTGAWPHLGFYLPCPLLSQVSNLLMVSGLSLATPAPLFFTNIYCPIPFCVCLAEHQNWHAESINPYLGGGLKMNQTWTTEVYLEPHF